MAIGPASDRPRERPDALDDVCAAAGGSVDVERLGSGRLAAGIERDLLDAGLGLAQQLLAAALEAFAALIDGNRLLKRNFSFLKSLHDGFKLLDGAFEGQALDVVV